jgi:hypothetical protein
MDKEQRRRRRKELGTRGDPPTTAAALRELGARAPLPVSPARRAPLSVALSTRRSLAFLEASPRASSGLAPSSVPVENDRMRCLALEQLVSLPAHGAGSGGACILEGIGLGEGWNDSCGMDWHTISFFQKKKKKK